MGKELAMVENNGRGRMALDVMTELPVSIVGPNFQPVEYLDKHGQMRRMIEFSEDVLANVLAVVGADLERVGVLLFVPEASHGTTPLKETANGLAPGYWLNFEQAIQGRKFRRSRESMTSITSSLRRGAGLL